MSDIEVYNEACDLLHNFIVGGGKSMTKYEFRAVLGVAINAAPKAAATPPASAELDDRLLVNVELMDKLHGAELRDHYPLAWGNVMRAAEVRDEARDR